eukprot:GFUD01032349.1.p1 GENE.GFUD01032349.1~~GFUD01032349.1.p1  ORF type:complete len:823 (+),score=166.44 GFUD01032349.1:67-2535(+)
MAQNPSFEKFRNAILENLLNFNEKDEYCDLEVHCADGIVLVHGLVFGTLCPPIKSLSLTSLDDFCILLPDISSRKLLVFLRCLFNGRLREINVNTLEILKEVADILGTLDVPNENQKDASTVGEIYVSINDVEGESNDKVEMIDVNGKEPVNLENCKNVLNNSEELSQCLGMGFGDSDADLDKKCLLNLAAVDLEKVTDDILTENFSDQVGRLVCLVCYKILGPSDFNSYRSHVKEHEYNQLEKVTIILPDIGRGGPGLKKKFVSDFELENMYKDESGTFLVCNKCDRRTSVSEKSSFRKHLTYHTHKEKNYMYQCPKCTNVFSDPSNLKRHVQSIHEKQVFRCLHCDFEDNRKKRLEDHLLNAHSDKVGGDEETSLDKGGGSEAIADLSANEASLPSFNSTENDSNVFISPKRSSPNIMQKYSYQCTGCKFRKRKLLAVENHVVECHSESPNLLIKKIALKSKEMVDKIFPCSFCSLSFKKRTLLNQHNFRVHEVQLDSEYACNQCGVRCANLPGLKAHTRAHLTKRFLCGSCNKSFLVLSQLKDHVDKGVCLLENRQCSVCKKIFSGKHHLDLHMRLHTNTKPHPCNICEKTFTQKRSLKEHLLTHDTVRHFECQHCSKKFVQKNHLKYHVASQHFETDTEISKHQCNICGKVFPFPYQLKKHKNVHGNNTAKELHSQFQCRSCSTWFSSPALLKLHSIECPNQQIPRKDGQKQELQKPNERTKRDPNSGSDTAIAVVLNRIETSSDSIEEFTNIAWDQNEVIVESEDLTSGEAGESLQLAVEQISGTNQYQLVNVPGIGNLVNYSVESEEGESFSAQLL